MHWKWLILLLPIILLAGCRRSDVPAVEGTPVAEPTATQTAAPTVAGPTATQTAAPTTTEPVPTPLPTATPPAAPLDRFEQGKRLGRGVNLGNALEAPREGEWGMALEEEFFQLIGEAGFDTVRVPIRWSAHAMTKAPYTIDETFLERVDWVIETAFANGLNVIINMHHYDPLFKEPSAHRERFVAMWRQIVLRYREMPGNLYFEPLNEPHGSLGGNMWNKLLAETVAAIRELDKVHTIIVTGAEWGGIEGLTTAKIPEGETNYVCSFHFYEPFPFTHQGAEWVDGTYSTGVQWPGPPEVKLTPDPAALDVSWRKQWYDHYNNQPPRYNPCGPEAITRELDRAVVWGEKLDCHLLMGEFGAYGKADMQSRINWTTFMREEAEKRGFSWAYWEFGAGFGVYDRSAERWNEGLLKALVPEE